jgi:hypothetical protein
MRDFQNNHFLGQISRETRVKKIQPDGLHCHQVEKISILRKDLSAEESALFFD